MNDEEELFQNTTAQAIDAHMPRDESRGHLGMSQIGKEDARSLWLSFRWSLPNDYSARTLRIFAMGNLIEDEIIRLLRNIPGVELHDKDADGKQFRFAEIGGHFCGSMDGAIRGIPEAPKTWHVFEAKSVSGKRFADLQKKGVKEWSPEYYGQLQSYMRCTGMERALFVAYCKDNSELYIERVKYDAQHAEALLIKAERIITATEPPASSWPNEQWYESKFLGEDARAIYWGKRLPSPNCRNCRFSEPDTKGNDSNWYCNLPSLVTYQDIPYKLQKKGCEMHNFIPALVPAKCVSLNDESAEYRTIDGHWFMNSHGYQLGAQAYTSWELEHLSKTGLDRDNLANPDIQFIRSEFDATIIGADA
jgi:hypothetical protein